MPVLSRSLFPRVPEDVWRMIFLASIESYSMCPYDSPDAVRSFLESQSPVDTLLRITRTCRSWRITACEMPELWQTIIYGDVGAPLNSLERIKTWLSRSGSRTLQVDIFAHGNRRRREVIPEALMSVLGPHFSRVSVLNVIGLPSTANLKPIFTCLTSATSDLYRYPVDAPTRLTSLRLTGLRVGFRLQIEMAEWLSRSPFLESLHIEAEYTSNWNGTHEESPALVLPSLRAAILDARVLYYLLSHGLQPPSLSHLRISGIGTFVTFGPGPHNSAFIIDPFASSLQTLAIIDSASDELLILTITPASNLRTLSLDGCQAGVDFLHFLSRPNSLPKLKLLIVRWGSFNDDAALSLLNSRPGDLMLSLSECWNTTPRLGAELQRRGRGIWVPFTERPATWT